MSIYIDSRCDRFSCWCQHRQGRDSAVLSGPFSQRRFSDPSHHLWHKETKMALMPVIRKIEDEHRVCRYKPKTSLLLWHTKGELLKNILAILCNIMIVNHKRCREKKKTIWLQNTCYPQQLLITASKRSTTLHYSKCLFLCSTEDSQSYRF